MDFIGFLKRNYYARKMQAFLYYIQIKALGEKKWIEKNYKASFNKTPDLANPITLNEKINWLKLNYYQDFYKECCDKYYIHDYLIKRLKYDYSPRLLFYTSRVEDLKNDNIPEFPCIIKVSNGTGTNLIVDKKNQYSDAYLQNYFKTQIVVANSRVMATREHQYYTRAPYLVVEELLQDDQGSIPNDIKIFCFNQRIEFVYCSVDRKGSNVRQMYDENWNRLHFIWVPNASKEKYEKYEASVSIPMPHNFDEMKRIALEISKDFPFVRVDFYETSKGLFIGEITLHHGSGYDTFYPEKYDEFYGKKLELPDANR